MKQIEEIDFILVVVIEYDLGIDPTSNESIETEQSNNNTHRALFTVQIQTMACKAKGKKNMILLTCEIPNKNIIYSIMQYSAKKHCTPRFKLQSKSSSKGNLCDNNRCRWNWEINSNE